MEAVFLVFFFSWYTRNGPAVDMETVAQASMEQCEANGAALSNDVPTIAVVVPDLASQSLFPLLGSHDCCRDLEQF